MLHIRPFLNTDPPFILDVWQNQSMCRGRYDGLDGLILEQQILAKPYFDPHGFLIAFEEERPVGFIHAGFGATDDESKLDYERGTISQLMVIPSVDRPMVAGCLIDSATDYLKRKGAGWVTFGGHFPSSPFYNGLYGGSRSVGVLSGDAQASGWLEENQFVLDGQVSIRHWELADFRPLMDRKQLMIGRSFILEAQLDPVPQTWFEACTIGLSSRIGFFLKDRRSKEVVGRLTFWDMEPLVKNWGMIAMGLVKLWVSPDLRGEGLATYMVGESLRQLKQQGVSLVEIQHVVSEKKLENLCDKLGFKEIDRTNLYSKRLAE